MGLESLAWRLAGAPIYFAWDHVSSLVTAGLFAAALWTYHPIAASRVMGAISNAISRWGLIALNGLMYYPFALPATAWSDVAIKMSHTNERFWAWLSPHLARYCSIPPVESFSYSTTASFNPASEIRLLKLHRKFPLLQLSAELISYPLSSAPSYHAISYVWAHGPQHSRNMLLNGGHFSVRANVYDILANCSSIFRPHFIWIDTICIDQGNITEKSLQVRAMQDIYAKAAHVLVCLGGTWSHPALSSVYELQLIERTFGMDFLRAHVTAFRELQKDNPYLRARIQGLVEIMLHPWFSRVWVMQETVVATHVTFFWGGSPLEWGELYAWQRILCDRVVFSNLTSCSQQSWANLEQMLSPFLGFLSLSFIVANRAERSSLGPNRLSYVLRVFGEKDATEPIDKVVALVGMTAESKDGRLQHLIDYLSRPREDFMLDVANYLLDTGQALEVMDLAGLRQQSRISELPSWAVDWTAKRSGMPLNSQFANQELQYHSSDYHPGRIR